MKVSKGFIAFLFTLGVLLGSRIPAGFIFGAANAAPQDIRGSANTAVASFKTEAGIYSLFTDGTVVDVSTGTSLGNRYEEAKGVTHYQPVKGQALGSPNVAVDVVYHPKGTYVLFADGNIRKHSDPGASAPPAVPRIEHGFWNGSQLYSYSKGIKRVTGSGGIYSITFDPPFEKLPSIQMTPVEGGVIGWVTFPRGQSTNISRIDVAFKNVDGDYNPSAFTFVATGN